MNIKDVLLAQIDRSTSVAFNKQINLKSHFFLIYKIEALMHFLLTFQSMSSIIYSPYVLLLSPANEMCSVFFKTNDLTKKQIKNYCFTPFSWFLSYSLSNFLKGLQLLPPFPHPFFTFSLTDSSTLSWVFSSSQNLFLLWSLMTSKFQVRWRFSVVSWVKVSIELEIWSDTTKSIHLGKTIPENEETGSS